MNAFFDLGAKPVNLQAAKLLWASPWWAKLVAGEVGLTEVEISEDAYEGALVQLHRDFTWAHKRRPNGEELYGLSQMARNVRWDVPKFVNTFRKASQLSKIKIKLELFKRGIPIKGSLENGRLEKIRFDFDVELRKATGRETRIHVNLSPIILKKYSYSARKRYRKWRREQRIIVKEVGR